MEDDSVNVYARLKPEMPTLLTFTICTWVKAHFEVNVIRKTICEHFNCYGAFYFYKVRFNFSKIFSENIYDRMVLLCDGTSQ